MSYLVFARKYRPETFQSVLGQDHVVQTLANAIAQERLAHAYLFVGPRGTGKTTTARIFAKALNCSNGPSIDFDPNEDICLEIAEGRSLDVLEIDGASNNGVDQVRELRETVQFAPARCRYKIIYIDEVHMLSSAAFNALLKTLEEPPPHVKFIFATTEPHKILPTIISRCQRFDLRPIPTETIAEHLQTVASQEGITIQSEAAWTVAKGADGGMRDALSMLDQLVAFCGENITAEHVREIFGFTSGETVHAILKAVFQKETAATLQLIQEQHALGKDLSQLLGELIQSVRALLLYKVQQTTPSSSLPQALWNELETLITPYSAERLLAVLDLLAESEAKIRWSSDKALHVEIALIRATQALSEVSLNDLIKTLGRLPSDTPLGTAAAALPPSTPPAKETPPASTQEPRAGEATTPPAQAAPPSEPPEKPEEKKEAPPAPSTPVNPLESPPTDPSERPSRPGREGRDRPEKKRSTMQDISQSLDRLLESAPEQLPPPEEPPPSVQASTTKGSAPSETPREREEPPSQAQRRAEAQVDFHKDPLIQEALALFQGTLQNE